MIIFKTADIQHIVEQRFKVVGLASHVLKIFADFIYIADIALGHFDHVHNTVKRSPDIMRKVRKEPVLGLIESLSPSVGSLHAPDEFAHSRRHITGAYRYKFASG